MRKYAAIAILLLAAAIIGYEQIKRGSRLIVSDQRTPHDGQPGRTAETQSVIPEAQPMMTQQVHENPHAKSGRLDDTEEAFTAIDSTQRSNPVEVSVTGRISPLHFIRSSAIFGNEKPTKDQLERLKAAVATAGDALRPGVLIFDADACTTSHIPALIYVREDFDMTGPVKEIYLTLEKESKQASLSSTESEVGN
jgi:hypothetical protein